jgi:general stress protein 26
MPNASNLDDVRKLGQLIRRIKFAMLTTRDPHGSLTSRPLTTLDVDFDGTLWFLVGADSNLVQDLRQHPGINVAYAAPDAGNYISVSGAARALRDPVRARELWTPVARIWFDQGPDDPKLAVLKIEVQRAEYWDAPGGRVERLIRFGNVAPAHHTGAERT